MFRFRLYGRLILFTIARPLFRRVRFRVEM